MRARLIVALLVIAVLVIAVAVARFFTGGSTSSLATATASPSTTASSAPTPSSSESPAPSPLPSPSGALAEASSSASAGPTSTPTPLPTPTPDNDLLSYKNGTFVRRWTVGGGGGGNALAMEHIYGIDPKFAKPLSFEFEMPSVAHVTGIGVMMRTTVRVTIRVATGTSLDELHDAGTLTVASSDGNTEQTMPLNANARYLQATFTRSPGTQVNIFKFAAYGTPGPPERGSFAGTWVGADNDDGDGDVMFPDVKGSVPYSLPVTDKQNPHGTLVYGTTFTDFLCDRLDPAWHATVSGDFVTAPIFGGSQGPQNYARLQLAGDGKLLIGTAAGIYGIGDGVVFMRDTRRGGICDESDAGTGPVVLALQRNAGLYEEEVDPAYVPGYRFRHVIPMLLDRQMLANARFAMLIDDCNATNDLLPYQQQLLLNWIAAGHKLIIRDSDHCTTSDYSFIPYKFEAVAPVAQGARGHVLSIADPSTLGSGPEDPAHFVDTAAYVNSKSQDLGDADIMQTDDLHWCGHMFARNVIGRSGWVHAYARYGRGLIIYDGFDHDDVKFRVPQQLAILRYEYALPAQAPLPCNAHVASALALYPGTDRRLAAGTPVTLHVPMSLTYVTSPATNQRIVLTMSGDVHYRASVSPATATMQSGQTIRVIAAISLPRGWSGVHAFTVSADGSSVKAHAQASITIDGSIALARAFLHQRRVRIYGIHFDVDSATILPQSEATIAQIAQVLRANPTWRMRVEGYTDSDGGAAYNLDLSNRRAHSVVADLVKRYKIAASRLVAVGFGLTHPVAPNTTAGGKALNRRVELVRL
jgi:outer membrane protein OmpA-like peptidoglycan-associated protein